MVTLTHGVTILKPAISSAGTASLLESCTHTRVGVRGMSIQVFPIFGLVK